MDKQTVQEAKAESVAQDVLTDVLGDDPQAARRRLSEASFTDRALALAWLEEAARLARDEQTQYEARERRAWRDVMDGPLATG